MNKIALREDNSEIFILARRLNEGHLKKVKFAPLGAK